jgi:hypothetical protein
MSIANALVKTRMIFYFKIERYSILAMLISINGLFSFTYYFIYKGNTLLFDNYF